MTKWPLVPLGKLCEVVGGGTPKRDVEEYFGGSIPWATPTDVTALKKPEISKTRETLTERGLQRSSARLFPARTVLLTSRATLGFTAVAQVPMCTNQGFANFICRNGLLPEFLALWLPTRRAEMERMASHTTFKEVSKFNLKRFEISLPPLEQQCRIVDILNRANGIRRLRRESLDKARQLIPALFGDMFGDPASNPNEWPVKALGDVVGGFEGGRNLQPGPEEGNGLGYRILKISAVTSGHYNPNESKPAPVGYQPPPSHFVRPGDLLFSRANTVDLVGASVLVRSTPPNVLLPDKIWRVKWKSPSLIVPEFLLALLQNASVRRTMGRLATGTSDSMRNISKGRLLPMLIPVPPERCQRDFASRVVDIQATTAQQERMAEASEQLVAVLMARLFGGAASKPDALAAARR